MIIYEDRRDVDVVWKLIHTMRRTGLIDHGEYSRFMGELVRIMKL